MKSKLDSLTYCTELLIQQHTNFRLTSVGFAYYRLNMFNECSLFKTVVYLSIDHLNVRRRYKHVFIFFNLIHLIRYYSRPVPSTFIDDYFNDYTVCLINVQVLDMFYSHISLFIRVNDIYYFSKYSSLLC